MSKEREKKRQLKEQLRQSIAKNYKDMIVELQRENTKLLNENTVLKANLKQAQAENQQLKDYVEHIKTLTKLSNEELDTLVQNSKDKEKVLQSLSSLLDIRSMLGDNF